MILETERLLLRPWDISDAESLFEYAKNPDVGPVAGWPPHRNIEESIYVIHNVLHGAECYAICLKEDNRAIGSIELKLNGHTDMTDRDDECELGYWLGKPFWGNGYMPEAIRELIRYGFEDLSMTAIWCGYYEGNLKSKRAQEKCGFIYHHTIQDMKVPLLKEVRVGHCSILTKEQWLRQREEAIMLERFGKDSLISLATACDNIPYVRTVNAFYDNGAFYVLTHARSNKIKQIEKNPTVAISGDWFTANGTAVNLGYFGKEENAVIAGKMREVFAEWIDNGHNNFEDVNTIILCIKLTKGVLFSHGTRYEIDFTK